MDAALVEALTAQLKVLSDQLAKKDEQIQLLSQLVLQKDELIVAKDLRIKELEQASADKDFRPPPLLSNVRVSSSFPLLNLEIQGRIRVDRTSDFPRRSRGGVG